MKKGIFLGPLILPLMLTVSSIAAPPEALFPQQESTEALNIYNKTRQSRSRFSMDFKTSQQKDRIVYEMHAEGNGGFDKYQNARWTIHSEMIPDGDFIKPLWTRTIINDLTNQNTITSETRFDYPAKKIRITTKESKHPKNKTFVFPLKGRTADYATLCYFLKPFVANQPKEKNQSFYLLTIEPALYKVNLKFVRPEKLTLPLGEKDTWKFRLIADFGILDDVFDRMIPPTFIWYEGHAPFAWLQYQGMETGLHSPDIISTVNEVKVPAR